MASIIKSKLSNSLQIGIIRHCVEDFTFGVIQSWDNQIFYRFYTFPKDKAFCLDENTLVIFSRQSGQKEVSHVTPLDAFQIIPNEWKTSERDNGCYYGDNCWEHLVSGKPFIRYEADRLSVIYLPESKGKKLPISIIETILSGIDEYIFSRYYQIKTIDCSLMQFSDLAKMLSTQKKYIDSLNIPKIISEFKVMQIKRLQRRPGKDDHYFIDLYQNLPTEDVYLNYLLPTKQENISFDGNWNSATDEDNSGVYVLEKQSLEQQQKALSRYSKVEHLAYLIHDYYETRLKNRQTLDKLTAEIYGILGIYNDFTYFGVLCFPEPLIEDLKRSGHY